MQITQFPLRQKLVYVLIIPLCSKVPRSEHESHKRRSYTLQSLDPQLTAIFLQPPALDRAFFWDRLLLLLAGDFTIVETMDESESASDDQQACLVAEVVPESFLERSLRKIKLRKGYSDSLGFASPLFDSRPALFSRGSSRRWVEALRDP